MKKLISLFCAICLCFSLSACAKTPYEEVAIDATQLKEKIDNKETFVFMVIRDNCPYCDSLYKYIEVSKNEHPNLVIYLLDCSKFELGKNEDGTLNSSTEEGKYLLSIAPYFKYTPTIYKVEEGIITITGVGFNEGTNCVSLWPNDSVIDFGLANTENYWEFIQID
ncbi:MAG: hypothetical protein HUJ53_04480 [Holdemanella sp.]|nr:hypothetical protein [Holdemanella sp.]